MTNFWEPGQLRHVLPRRRRALPAFLAAQAVAIFCIIAAIMLNFWSVSQLGVAVIGWAVVTVTYATWRLAARRR